MSSDFSLRQRRRLADEIAKVYRAWKKRLRREPTHDERRQIVAIGFERAKIAANPALVDCVVNGNPLVTLPETVVMGPAGAVPMLNPSFAATMAGAVAGNLIASALSNPPSGPADETAARELELYIENDRDLYFQQFTPIVRNLMRRRKNGTFDFEKSVTLWMYLADNGARKYVREFDTPGTTIDTVFNKNTRLVVARSLATSFVTEADLGNYDNEAMDPTFVKTNPGFRAGGDGTHGSDIVFSITNEMDPHTIARLLAPGGGAFGYDMPTLKMNLWAFAAWINHSGRTFKNWREALRAYTGRAVPRKNPLLMTVMGANPGRASKASGIPRCSCGRQMELIGDGGKQNIHWECRCGKTRQLNPAAPTVTRGKKVTISLEEFARRVKSMNDPAIWNNFVAKIIGYKKWSHGTLPEKVTLEQVESPGVTGLMVTYDAGRQPESTYIMPGGTKRTGAWVHEWESGMPEIKHDPEAGIVITKLTGRNKISDFYHR